MITTNSIRVRPIKLDRDRHLYSILFKSMCDSLRPVPSLSPTYFNKINNLIIYNSLITITLEKGQTSPFRPPVFPLPSNPHPDGLLFRNPHLVSSSSWSMILQHSWCSFKDCLFRVISQSRYIVIRDVKAQSVIYESNHISNNIRLIPAS